MPTKTPEHDERIRVMTVASAWPLCVDKVQKKARTQAKLHQVVEWLTGFGEARIQELIETGATFEDFFAKATLHPNADRITSVICGYRIEDIETPPTRQCRYLDKLVDELAKGRKMEKILRARASRRA